MANYTLTYSEGAPGWVSFYSYYPDWMIGMNNYFYTFKGGDLYRHNVNENRNTFYTPWNIKNGTPNDDFFPTTLQSVFNQSPLENKLFKTIDLQGDATWGVSLQTDIQVSGFISANWFEKKEGTFFAFIRNNTAGELKLRSVNGIGKSSLVTGSGLVINFALNISIGSIISIGDLLYFLDPPSYSGQPLLAGRVTAITVDLPNGINRLTISTTGLVTFPILFNNCFFFYVKNSIAESHGVLGHYCVFNLENFDTNKIELFTIESDVMKSFP
jgi:hypothetical protein